MASMQDMKHRQAGIRRLHQMTKAMQLVSAVKFQKAKKREEKIREYFQSLRKMTGYLWEKLQAENMFGLNEKENNIQDIVVISSDRGLAGGYNSHVVRLAEETASAGQESVFYVFGKKGKELLKQKGLYMVENVPGEAAEAGESAGKSEDEGVKQIAEMLWERYRTGKCGSSWLIYTEFRNALTQTPKKIRLLPPETEAGQQPDVALETEPEEGAFLEQLIPFYLTGMLQGARTQAETSENGARMQAMDMAAQSAEGMLTQLVLQYNRIRQGNITRELAEIVAGGAS